MNGLISTPDTSRFECVKDISRKGWAYRTYTDDIGSEALGPFSDLVALWRGKSDRQQYPAWRDFDLPDFAGWWGRLSLAEIKTDPFDIEFALWGTTLTNWWGIDYTRKKMSDAYENRRKNWEAYEGPYFKQLWNGGKIGVISGDLRVIGRQCFCIAGVDLPLMTDGKITHVLSGYCPIDEAIIPLNGAMPLWQV